MVPEGPGFDNFIANALSNRNSNILKDPRASHIEMRYNVEKMINAMDFIKDKVS